MASSVRLMLSQISYHKATKAKVMPKPCHNSPGTMTLSVSRKSKSTKWLLLVLLPPPPWTWALSSWKTQSQNCQNSHHQNALLPFPILCPLYYRTTRWHSEGYHSQSKHHNSSHASQYTLVTKSNDKSQRVLVITDNKHIRCDHSCLQTPRWECGKQNLIPIHQPIDDRFRYWSWPTPNTTPVWSHQLTRQNQNKHRPSSLTI